MQRNKREAILTCARDFTEHTFVSEGFRLLIIVGFVSLTTGCKCEISLLKE